MKATVLYTLIFLSTLLPSAAVAGWDARYEPVHGSACGMMVRITAKGLSKPIPASNALSLINPFDATSSTQAKINGFTAISASPDLASFHKECERAAAVWSLVVGGRFMNNLVKSKITPVEDSIRSHDWSIGVEGSPAGPRVRAFVERSYTCVCEFKDSPVCREWSWYLGNPPSQLIPGFSREKWFGAAPSGNYLDELKAAEKDSQDRFSASCRDVQGTPIFLPAAPVTDPDNNPSKWANAVTACCASVAPDLRKKQDQCFDAFWNCAHDKSNLQCNAALYACLTDAGKDSGAPEAAPERGAH